MSSPGLEAQGGRPRLVYRTQVAAILATAFTLSLIYSIIVTLTGAHDGYTLAEPSVLWIFYPVGFGLVALALANKTWAWWVVSATVMVMILAGIFYYPTIFPPSAQTPFAWFENDVYLGLLILAEYLCILRLRAASMTP